MIILVLSSVKIGEIIENVRGVSVLTVPQPNALHSEFVFAIIYIVASISKNGLPSSLHRTARKYN